MASSDVHCLIGQTACGRKAGNPVCPKCGIDERVVYPGQADLEVALEAARARYAAAQEEVKSPQPLEPPEPPAPSAPPPQQPMQPAPEPPASLGPQKKWSTRLGVSVLVIALLGGGWWWKDQQDHRAQQAKEQVAEQTLAAEQARRDRDAEMKVADEAEAQRVAAEKAKAQIAAKAQTAASQNVPHRLVKAKERKTSGKSSPPSEADRMAQEARERAAILELFSR